MSAEITMLRPNDRVLSDPSPILNILEEMGFEAGMLAINRAKGEIALSVGTVEERLAARNLAGVPRDLRRIGRLADHLGLRTLAICAREAEARLGADATAFAAIWARTLRVGACQLTSGASAKGLRG